MVKKNYSIQLIAVFAMTLFFAFNSGTAQESKIDSIAYNNVVNMVVEALKDSCINIVLCKVSDFPWYYETVSRSRDTVNNITHTKISSNKMLKKLQFIDNLRGDNNIDSLFFIYRTTVLREGSENQFPFLSFYPSAEFILLLDSPFRQDHYNHTFLMEQHEKSIGKELLNSSNFFTLYEMGSGALSTYCPEDAEYPPRFIYTKELVNDIKTIIKLQKDPSVLLESADSYDRYYSLIKDDLGKRVFTKLFDSRKEIVEMVADALNDSSISIALCRVQSFTSFANSDSGISGIEIYPKYKELRLIEIKPMQILRGNFDEHSTIYLNWFPPVNGEINKVYLSLLIARPGLECIFLFDSPYHKRNPYQVSLLELYEKYDKQSLLNSNNFFSLYEMGAGALPVHVAEQYNYPPEIIFSKDLVDDFRTIIELQENPSLLSESDDSYNSFYSSMKEDLGKRVFSQLFENPNHE